MEAVLQARPSLALHVPDLARTIANELALRFVAGTRRLFWWEGLKVPYVWGRTASFGDLCDKMRLLFPDPDEVLLLFPTNSNYPPWLLFEGVREEVVFVMGESFSSEFMIARRPLDVIVFVNHHDIMVVAGADARAVERLGSAFRREDPAVDQDTTALVNRLDHDRRAARRSFGSSLMSDAKWCSLLVAVRSAGLDVRQVVVKFVDVADARRIWLPMPHGQAYADSLELGPFPFVGIEWLEFPHMALLEIGKDLPPQPHRQDVVAIRATLDATGKRFPLEETPTGLCVIGHAASDAALSSRP